jgi:hypothetical protein
MRRSVPLLKFVDYHRVLGVPRDAGKVRRFGARSAVTKLDLGHGQLWQSQYVYAVNMHIRELCRSTDCRYSSY